MINNRFLINKKLGEGRSKVFLCSDSFNQNKQYAIKILSCDVNDDEQNLFLEEFFTLKKLNHPNIILPYEYGTALLIDKEDEENFDIETGSQFIVEEFFDGKQLLEYPSLKNESVILEIIKQISSVLFYLHQSNYIYYDLKPENILISEINGKPFLKFIDFGFTRFFPIIDEDDIRGTAEYIAPEILKRDFVDYRADLYAFGIILYRIIYNRFPFETRDQLQIYKDHLETEFNFPACEYDYRIIKVIKKLLAKEPSERYFTTLEIFFALDIPISDNIKKDWSAANCFSDRKDVFTSIDKYLENDNPGDVLFLRGSEGSGRSSILDQVDYEYNGTVYLKNYPIRSDIHFWKILIHQFVFNKYIFNNIDKSVFEELSFLLESDSPDILDKMKAFFFKITAGLNLIILIDDINLYNNFSRLILLDLILILQVNKIKVIVTEDDNYELVSDKINNSSIFNITPFADEKVEEFIDERFADFFPKDDIKKLIIKYSDFFPGNIVTFIQDLMLLNIIEYTLDGPIVDDVKVRLGLLEKSQEEIYDLRIHKLTPIELNASELISLFKSTIDSAILSSLLKVDELDMFDILSNLKEKNILQGANLYSSPQFTSTGLKNHIFTNIENRREIHLKYANEISKSFPDFNKSELARQFELAESYDESYLLLMNEVKSALRLSAYAYAESILKHILDFPLSDEKKYNVNFELSKILNNLGESNSCLQITEKLLKENPSPGNGFELKIQKGRCLLKLGELEKGKKLLSDILNKITDENIKSDLFMDISYADFDMGNYSKSSEIANDVINSQNSSPETIGRAYTILGLVSIYQDKNFSGSIDMFNSALNVYEHAELKSKKAGIELNMGNIYSMQGAFKEAEEHWDNAIALNQSVGNLEQEANIQLNYGTYYYDKFQFEKAIDQYKRAYNIFNSSGNLNGLGLVLSNLGEAFTAVCEYQLASDSLNRAANVFRKTLNSEEEAEVIMLQGKLHYVIGNYDELRSTKKYFENFIEKKDLKDKQKYNRYYLEVLDYLSKGSNLQVIKKLNILKKYYLDQSNSNLFVHVTFLLAYSYLDNNKINSAYTELCGNEFSKLCDKKLLHFAEREYIFGILSSRDSNIGLNSPIEHFKSAYDCVKTESITELTWKILFALSDSYIERGNLTKAREYIIYAKSLIKFIADNIDDSEIKDIYLSQKERKDALNKLEIFENKY